MTWRDVLYYRRGGLHVDLLAKGGDIQSAMNACGYQFVADDSMVYFVDTESGAYFVTTIRPDSLSGTCRGGCPR